MRFLFSSIAMVLCLSTQAQVREGMEKEITREVPDCYSIGYNFQRLIPRYYSNGNTDSIEAAMDYYHERCPVADHFVYFEIIWSLINNNFTEEDYPDLMRLLISYRSNFSTPAFTWDHPRGNGNAWAMVNEEFYRFLAKLSLKEWQTGRYAGLEADLLKYFSGDWQVIMEPLRENEKTYPHLERQYEVMKKDIINSGEFKWGIFGGAWMPQDNLSQLGTHPEIGLTAGGYTNRMHYDFSVGFRFVDAPNDYRVRDDDSIFVSDHFTSLYVGFEPSYSLFRNLKHELDLGGGIAYDGINFVPQRDLDENETRTLGSLNLSVALGYSFFIKASYLRLEGRYHFLNYSNRINQDFHGDAVSLRLTWGGTSNYRRERFAEAMKP